MPPRTRKRNYKKKRAYKKKRWGYSGQPRKTLMPSTFPVKLTYCENIRLNNATLGAVDTAGGVQIYRANGMFSPNVTLFDHQPRGFDELLGATGILGLYQHFTVIGSKLQCFFSNTNGADYGIGYVMLSSSLGLSGDKLDWQEARDGRNVVLPPKSATSSAKRLTASFSVKKDMGIKNPLSNTAIRGDVSTDPSQQQYYKIGVAAQDNSLALGECLVEVRIDYIAVMTDPITPLKS